MSSESDEILSSESGDTLNWSDLSVDTQSIREGSNTVEVPSSMSTNNNNNEEASGAAANEFDNQSRGSNLLAGGDVGNNNNDNIDVDNRSDGNSNRSIGRLPPVPPHQHQPRNTNNNNRARDPSVILPSDASSSQFSWNHHVPSVPRQPNSIGSYSGNRFSVPPPPPRYGSGGSNRNHPRSQAGFIGRTIQTSNVRNRPPPPPPRQRNHGNASISSVPSLTSSSHTSSTNTGGGGGFDKLFSLAKARADEYIIDFNDVILPKKARGKVGSSEWQKNRKVATEGITHKLGVQSYLQSDEYGEEDGNDSKRKYIQDEQLVNTTKVDEIKSHIRAYDFDNMFEVYRVKPGVDINDYIINRKDLRKAFDTSTFIHGISQWEELSFEDVCRHQLLLNYYNDDNTGREWCLSFLRDSVTIDLLTQLNLKYDELDPRYKGCVTFAWLLMQETFGCTREILESMQTFLKILKRKGMGYYSGENVFKATTDLKNMATRLNSAGELRRETTKDAVTALSMCTVDTFKRLFQDYLLDIEKHDLDVGGGYMWGQTSTLGEIQYICSKALEKYKAMCKAGLWVSPVKGRSRFGAATNDTPGDGWANGQRRCFNCDGTDHDAKNCPKPFNKKEFERRRDAYYEQRRKNGNGGVTTTPNNYNRKKAWDAPGKNDSHCKLINNVAHHYCKKCNNGNGKWVTDHSAGSHDKASKPGWTLASLAELQPQHPLLTMGKRKSSGTKNSEKSNGSGGGSNNNDKIDKDMATAALKRIKNSASTPEAERVMEESARALGLDF